MRFLPHFSPGLAARVGLPVSTVLLALALTACGGGNTTVVATPTPAPAPTPTPPPSTDQSCAAANTHCAPQP